jgi:putative heme transporter
VSSLLEPNGAGREFGQDRRYQASGTPPVRRTEREGRLLDAWLSTYGDWGGQPLWGALRRPGRDGGGRGGAEAPADPRRGCWTVNTSPRLRRRLDPPAAGCPWASGSRVPPGVALLAGYAWLLIVLAAAVYLVFVMLARVKLAVLAIFGALVITALLRPLVDLLNRVLPRALAVAASLLAALAVVVGLVTFIGFSLAGQASGLTGQFQRGLGKITDWLRTSPLHVHPQQVDRAIGQARHWLAQHRGALAGQALGGAGTAAEVFTGVLLALFCAVFFLGSGDRMWGWCLRQIPTAARGRWDAAARAGWTTFQGYARATVVVAASNAALVAAALIILRVPLALALGLLVFLASFVPVVGGAFSLAVAALVALAARGPIIALVVLILIPVLGQVEGHVLQPLITSRSVRLHPVVVVVTVVSGGLLGGIVGAVVAVPIVAVAWSVLSQLRDRGH